MPDDSVRDEIYCNELLHEADSILNRLKSCGGHWAKRRLLIASALTTYGQRCRDEQREADAKIADNHSHTHLCGQVIRLKGDCLSHVAAAIHQSGRGK